MEAPAANLYVFDNFRLDAHEKVLWQGDSLADVTPKAVEILLVLVENAGRLVSKEEILRVVWAESFVEEANLSHHIFRLRKALGESEDRKFIETVSKRGYRFVRPVDRIEDHRSNGLPASAVPSSAEAQALYESSRAGSKSTPWIGLGVLFLVLLAGLFVWFRSGSATNVSRTPPEATSGQMTIARVTNNGKVGAATISPDGKFVAYSQNYNDGVGTLYVRQTDTNAEVQLLEPDERTFGSKAFSADGSYIYYVTYDKRDPEGALYRIPVIGGQPTRLLGDVRNMFTLSPDGKKVAFFRDEPDRKQNSLIVAAVDGGGERKVLTRGYDEMKLGICPAISPEGNSIAFAASENSSPSDAGLGQVNVFSVDIENGRPTKISNEALTGVGMMNWMPDGTGLVLVGERPRTGNQIYFLSYPSGELHRITKELSSYGNYGLGITADGTTLVADLWDSSSQLWAVDTGGGNRGEGQQLTSGISDGGGGLAALSDGSVIYATRTGDDFDLWRMTEKNGKREGTPLTADAFYESDVCATDDNRFLVFASNRAGGQHLFRMDMDASNTKQLTSGDGFDSAPDCSRDGSAVVYNSVLNNQALVWKVSIDGGSPIPLTDFECIAPSFSPDGRMIACILPVDAVGKTATIAVISADGGRPEKTFDVIPFAWNYHAPRWTPDGKALVFGKRDKRPGNLWIQNLAGGEPKQFTDFKSQLIFNYAFSPDGKRLIVARGERKTNVVMIRNFKASL